VAGTISMGNTNLSTSGIAIDAAGDTLFVASMDGRGGGGVVLIDARTDTRSGGIGFIFTWPVGVTLSPGGSKLYVACRGTGAARDHYRAMLVIDVATRQVTGYLSTIVDPIGAYGTPPYAAAVHPAGRRVFVTTDDGLWSFDAATNALVARAPGATLRGVAVHPDGSRVYAADYGNGAVNVYDAATLRLVASVHVGSTPIALGIFMGPPLAPPPPPQALTPVNVPTLHPMALLAIAAVVGLAAMRALRR
jgi:YVTN family beta-propeller protein